MKDIKDFIIEGEIVSSKTPKKILTLGEFKELTKDISDDAKLYVDICETGWGPSFPNAKIYEFEKNTKAIKFRVNIKNKR